MVDSIDPTAIPGAELDPTMVEISANQMRLIGNDVSTQGGTVLTTWQKLAQHYEAPESATLFAVMDPVKTNAETFGSNVDTVSTALNTYAAEVEPIKAELAKIKIEAQSFVSSVADGVEKKTVGRGGVITENISWDEDEDSVNANNELISRVNAQMVLLWAAERKCANAIYDIIGFPHVEAADDANPNGYGVNEIPEGAEMPWGAAVERTESCGEQAVGAVKGFVWDGVIVGGVWGTVKGLGTLVLGYNPATGDWFSGDSYGAAWSNVGMLAFGLGTAGPLAIAGSAMPGPVGDFFRKGQETVVNAGKGLIAWDKWQDDPAAAAGESVFNVASILVPVGAATAPVRAGASTTAAAVRTAARVIDVMDPASAVVRLGAAGARVTLPAVSDLVKAVDLTSLNRLSEIGAGGKIDLPDLDVANPATRVEVPSVGRNDITTDVPGASNATDAPIRTPETTQVPVREPELVGAGGPGREAGGSGGGGGGLGSGGSGSGAPGSGSAGSGGDATPGGGGSGSDTPSGGKPPTPAEVQPAQHHEVARPADAQPQVGDTDNSVGSWQEINRGGSGRGLEDQAYATGVDLPPNGHPLEYVVTTSGGKQVDFDGHLYRGDPPAEVFQEVKGNYDYLYKPFPPGKTTAEKITNELNHWVDQAARQQDALKGSGATREWVLTRNPELVPRLEEMFLERGIDANVVYLPKP